MNATSGRVTAQVWQRYAGVIVALLACVLYLATLSRNYSADSLLYAMDIEADKPRQLFDPYHLLLHPLGWVFHQAWRLAGWSGRSMLPLQVLNALGGALSVGLVGNIRYRLTASAKLAMLVAAGFAVSGATWLLSIEAEFVTVPLAIQLLVLWGLVGVIPEERAKQPGYAVLLGLGMCLAAYGYLTGMFLLPVAVIGFLLSRDQAWPVRRRQIAILSGVFLLTFVPVFMVLVSAWADGDWAKLAPLMRGGDVYGTFSWASLPHGVYAFLRSLALFSNLGMNDSTRVFWEEAPSLQRVCFAAYYAAVLALAASPLVLATLRWRQLWQAHRCTLGILLSWAVLSAAFAIYWVVGDISFWVPVLAAWWLLVGLVIASYGDLQVIEAGRSSYPSHRPVLVRRWWSAILMALILCLLTANAVLLILPRHDRARNRPYQIAMSLGRHVSAEDLVLIRTNDLTHMYVSYFGDSQVLWLPEGAVARQGIPDYVSAEISRVRTEGGRVLVVGACPEEVGSEDAVPSMSQGCESQLLWRVSGETVCELRP